MGQKSHPYGMRLGYIKTWKTRWFSKKDYVKFLHEDLKLRKFLKEKLGYAGISHMEIERSAGKVRVKIYSARPGIIIGRRGQEIDKVKDEISRLTDEDIYIDIKEVKSPQTNAQLVAENVALQLEKRVAFRRAMKKAISTGASRGAKGIKVECSGRLGGAEIARRETYKEGSIPLNTLRADVDYGFTEAKTTYGTIGVKVWIFKGKVLVGKEEAEEEETAEKEDKKAPVKGHKKAKPESSKQDDLEEKYSKVKEKKDKESKKGPRKKVMRKKGDE